MVLFEEVDGVKTENMATTVMESSSRDRSQAIDRLGSLRAVVLLGGTVRPSRLSSAIDRPVFALPLDKERSILDCWREQTAALGRQIGRPDIPLRVMIDRNSPEPRLTSASRPELAPLQVERDPQDYRGTGGVLRDLAGNYDEDDLLLVANAAQVLTTSLFRCAAALAQQPGKIVVADHQDGTPSGLLLVRCSVLSLIAEAGFVDMKEQALPAIAKLHQVFVCRFHDATGLPVRSLAQYVEALRWYALRETGATLHADPFAENLESAFGLVEAGAVVDPSARLHDSVVLSGGIVEARATLVQSIVCPGGRVRRGQIVVDQVVAPAGSGGKPKG